MELNAKDKFKQIIKYLKSKIKTIPLSDYKIGIIFFYFLKLKGINKNVRYLIEIMKVMKYDEEELIFEPKYEVFYSKFFDLVLRNLDEKNKNCTDIILNINFEDLNHLNEDEKKIVFWYLEFSILVENALLLFFCFLNHEKNENKLISTFTYLNYDLIDNSNELQKSYRMQILSKELKKINKNKEINCIGFDSMETQYNIKNNSNRMKNSIENSKIKFPDNTNNIKDIKDSINIFNKKEEKSSKNNTSKLKNEQDNSDMKIKEIKNKNTSIENNCYAPKINPQDNQNQNDACKIIKISPEEIKKDKSLNDNNKSETKELLNNPINQNKCETSNFFEKNCLILDDDNNYDLLKKELSAMKVGSYCISQKEKYINIYQANNDLVENIKKLNTNNLGFNFSSNSGDFQKIKNALNKIYTIFLNEDEIVNPELGFFVTKNQILFYTSDEEEDINNNFFQKASSIEHNWKYFFDYNFELPKLPNLFFPTNTELNKMNKECIIDEKDEIIFKNYIDNLFNDFINIDVARINDSHSLIQPNIVFQPYIKEHSIHVYKKKQKNEWICELMDKGEFKVFSHSIVLSEILNFIPDKVLNIDDNDLINKIDIEKSLYFVLYKFIKKLEYYYDYIKYEYLNDKEKINEYIFQLFLIFNNDNDRYNINNNKMNDYILICFDNLIKKNLIKYEFIFQIVYSISVIDDFNMYSLSNKIEKLKDKIEKLEKNLNERNKNK